MATIACCIVSTGLGYWCYHTGKCSPNGSGVGGAADGQDHIGNGHGITHTITDAVKEPLLNIKENIKQIAEGPFNPDNNSNSSPTNPITDVTQKITAVAKEAVENTKEAVETGAGIVKDRVNDLAVMGADKIHNMNSQIKEVAEKAQGTIEHVQTNVDSALRSSPTISSITDSLKSATQQLTDAPGVKDIVEAAKVFKPREAAKQMYSR